MTRKALFCQSLSQIAWKVRLFGFTWEAIVVMAPNKMPEIPEGSLEPRFIIFENPHYHGFFFGIFIALAIILILLLRKKNVHTLWFFIAPSIGATLGLLLPTSFKEFIHYIIVCLDFPFSLVDAYLYTKLVGYFSRTILLDDKQRGLKYKLTVSVIAIPAIIYSVFIIYNGFIPQRFSAIYGISFAVLLFTFIYSVAADNGILTDTALVFLRACLSLAPAISFSAGYTTMILRFLLVIISAVSLLTNYSQPLFRGKNGRRATIIAVALFCSYALLSPTAFINIDPKNSGLQGVLIPVVFLLTLINEAMYYHVHITTPRRS